MAVVYVMVIYQVLKLEISVTCIMYWIAGLDFVTDRDKTVGSMSAWWMMHWPDQQWCQCNVFMLLNQGSLNKLFCLYDNGIAIQWGKSCIFKKILEY